MKCIFCNALVLSMFRVNPWKSFERIEHIIFRVTVFLALAIPVKSSTTFFRDLITFRHGFVKDSITTR